ncbi:MAG: UvrD-helicase domain-containing protein, partial [Clostridia bacterium]|nr:UvrD-helicase domain-containing protein [Clostridia bacterium]
MAKIKFNPEQERIINHRAGNMIVSASAGSGKTTVMLERVIRIIEEGTPIDRIVILAFNNSIAAEIRGKMYKKLVERLGKDDCTAKEFIKEQIDRLPFCNIITNDSYCKQSSSEFFQILGISPNSDILGDVEKNLLFHESFKNAVEQLKNLKSAEIFELSLKFGGENKLLEHIYIIHNYVSTQAGGMEWLDKVIGGVYTQDINKSSLMTSLFEMVSIRLDYAIDLLK